MKPRYSPPPQKPRRLPPIIIDDPFRYRKPLNLDISSDINLESGVCSTPPSVSNDDEVMPDHGMTKLPSWEEYNAEEVRPKVCIS